jgi:hypothetical protein
MSKKNKTKDRYDDDYGATYIHLKVGCPHCGTDCYFEYEDPDDLWFIESDFQGHLFVECGECLEEIRIK